MHRVYKTSGAPEAEIQAMRDALTAADIQFVERAVSLLGAGQAGLWVEDADAAHRARQVIRAAQAEWVQRVRSDPQSVPASSIFGTSKPAIWLILVIIILLNVVLTTELVFGW